MDWEQYVKSKEQFMRSVEVNYLKGNYSKAKKKLGWEPKVKFNELVEIMVKADFKRWQKWLKGEHFPWDASNYPDEKIIISRKFRYDK